MLTRREMEEKLSQAFSSEQVTALAEVLDTIQQIEIRRAADAQELKQGLAALAEAQARTEQRLAELAEAQARTEQRLAELAEAQVRTEQRVAELGEAQTRANERIDRLEAAIERLTEAQTRTEQQIAELAEAQRELMASQAIMQDRLGRVIGFQVEQKYRERAYAYFGRLLRGVRVVSLQEIEEELRRDLSDREIDELLPLDLLVKGQPRHRPDAPEVWLAVEISVVVDWQDVSRAQRRAALLRQIGYRAIPTVAGEQVTEGAEAAARDGHILLLQNGRAEFWEEALITALTD